MQMAPSRSTRFAQVLWLAVIALGMHSVNASAQETPSNLSQALTGLDKYVQDSMAKTKVPGVSVAVVYQDKVVFLKGYGVRRIGEPGRVNPDTVFEIASFSKPIASTVVAAVVGQGGVSWDSRIQDLDPDFKLSNPEITAQITVRDLLSHRSTLPAESGDILEALDYTRPEVLARLRLVPLKGVFRQTWQYSNFGITEGSLAATRHLGAWEDVSRDLLYSKLGMTRTSSRFTDYFNRSDRASLHYLGEDGVFRARYLREADAEAPGGGVSSSARDLAQWLRLQLAGGVFNGQQIVDEAALNETHSPQVCREQEQPPPDGLCPSKTFPVTDPACPGKHYYGLGWNVDYRANGETQLSHSGAFMLGGATTVYMIPSKQIGILVLTNGTPVGLPEAIALNFLADFEKIQDKPDYLSILEQTFVGLRNGILTSSTNYSTEKPPSNPSSGGPPSSYVGTYENAYYGKVEIEQEQGKFILRLPTLGTYYELSHWDGDTYTYYIGNEVSGAARRGIDFSGNGDAVTVENLCFEYSNVFSRIKQ
jgi:CubicO group peptidase (beta-lactamase class C family)